jgi:asparagine synthase (glutamine-hydrolysing)
MSLDFKIRRALGGLSYPASMWNPVWMAPVHPQQMSDLFSCPVYAEDVYSEAIAAWNGSHTNSIVDRSLEFYTKFYLQDNILAKVDRASMMVSLETRAIFLDNELVDFCRRLPHRFKLRGGQRKYLLKRAVARHLPNSILARPKKGFGIPLVKWLRSLPDERINSVPGLRDDVVAQWWGEHRNATGDHRLALWTTLAVQHVISADRLRSKTQLGAA